MINHLWQSTVFAVLAGLATLAFRKNRAQVRYWLWFSGSLKFFVPFSLLMLLGSRVPSANEIATPEVSIALEQVAEPFPEAVSFAPSPQVSRDWVPIAIPIVWACGFITIAIIRIRGWGRIRAAVRASVPIDIPSPVEIRSSPGLLEPGVVGLFHSILLVPEGIAERLTPRQIEAVLAHELCHVRRRDNLSSAIHMIVEALFWFHPLVWWIGARLVEERERACDEGVLSLGNEPQVYAEGILNVCKLYVESPLVCVSGVTGADLKKRIEAIMRNRAVFRLNLAKKVALAVAGTAVIAVPVFVGMMNTSHLSAQTAVPQWDGVSIRVCNPEKSEYSPGGMTPGRLRTPCASILPLIRSAYDPSAGQPGPHFVSSQKILGGPAWISSDRYQINAKVEGDPGDALMRGPMLQALLEDRFKLKVHRETREVPVYALTVAKGGPKLQPFKEGSCAPRELMPAPLPFCGPNRFMRKGPMLTQELHGISLADFSQMLDGTLDRPVIDKTGISGKFDFHWEFVPEDAIMPHSTGLGLDSEAAPVPPDAADGPSIFTAIQAQLGLKLESGKGRANFLVIDRVERPSEN
jgi:bla regulator protein blaR1